MATLCMDAMKYLTRFNKGWIQGLIWCTKHQASIASTLCHLDIVPEFILWVVRCLFVDMNLDQDLIDSMPRCISQCLLVTVECVCKISLKFVDSLKYYMQCMCCVRAYVRACMHACDNVSIRKKKDSWKVTVKVTRNTGKTETAQISWGLQNNVLYD